MATHSSILAKNPLYRGPWRATVHGVTRVGQNYATTMGCEPLDIPVQRKAARCI